MSSGDDLLNVKSTSETNDFAVKFEGSELPKIRRKVCRKIYTILMDELRVDKGLAKVATLNLEYRLNSAMDAVSSSEKAYLNYVKNVINDIKVGFGHPGKLRSCLEIKQGPTDEFGRIRKVLQALHLRRLALKSRLNSL